VGPIIVDTSVWVDFFRGQQTAQTILTADLLATSDSIAITPTILQEVLQGIWDDHRYETIKESLLACIMLSLDPVEAAIGTADLYRSLRKKGITIRKPNDCLIVYYAIIHALSVLHNDVDFNQITEHTSLQTVTF
jgi:predicted nucleic acid-binding protein